MTFGLARSDEQLCLYQAICVQPALASHMQPDFVGSAWQAAV
jgi:hypothetical protein